MNYNKTITLTEKEKETIKRLMVEPKNEDDWTGSGVLFGAEAKFDDGMIMDIDICGVDRYEEGSVNAPWTQAVLFTPEGREVCCSYVEESYTGEWELDYNDNTYLVNII